MTDFQDDKTKVVPKKGRPGDSTVPVTIRAIVKVLSGKDEGSAYQVSQSETTIGRGDNADITIDDEIISRKHALIVFSNLEFRIKDLESANGTILNGSEVKEYALRNNDKLIIGETMLQFTIERI